MDGVVAFDDLLRDAAQLAPLSVVDGMILQRLDACPQADYVGG